MEISTDRVEVEVKQRKKEKKQGRFLGLSLFFYLHFLPPILQSDE